MTIKFLKNKVLLNDKIKINLETFYDLNISLNKDIDIDKIYELDDYYCCYKYAIKLINSKNISNKKLNEKLLIKFKKESVNMVLFKLNYKENKDDYITSLINKGYGPNYIKYRIKSEGFNDINFNEINYQFNIDIFFNKYIRSHKNIKKESLIRYLMNKGYNYNDIINKIMEENTNDK